MVEKSVLVEKSASSIVGVLAHELNTMKHKNNVNAR